MAVSDKHTPRGGQCKPSETFPVNMTDEHRQLQRKGKCFVVVGDKTRRRKCSRMHARALSHNAIVEEPQSGPVKGGMMQESFDWEQNTPFVFTRSVSSNDQQEPYVLIKSPVRHVGFRGGLSGKC